MSTPASRVLFNALIRTHHITSRKKVAKLKQAAASHDVYVFLRSSGPPGIMYVEGSEQGVEAWVNVVQKLRYKDYQLASRAAEIKREAETETIITKHLRSGLYETESVKNFGLQMQALGVYSWWRKAMGYANDDERL